MDPLLWQVAGIIALSACARAAVGFGDAAIAMSLLTILIGVRAATPVVGGVGLCLSCAILARSWRTVDFAAAWRLILASWAGIPAGVWVLQSAPQAWVTGGLGVILFLFGGYGLLRPDLPPNRWEGWLWLLGWLAGALGAAYNVSGPPVVLVGALRRWSPQQFRGTMQGFFLPVYAGVVLSHILGGFWSRELLPWIGVGAPAALIGLAGGEWLHRRLAPRVFAPLLNGLLIALGALLLLRSL